MAAHQSCVEGSYVRCVLKNYSLYVLYELFVKCCCVQESQWEGHDNVLHRGSYQIPEDWSWKPYRESSPPIYCVFIYMDRRSALVFTELEKNKTYLD